MVPCIWELISVWQTEEQTVSTETPKGERVWRVVYSGVEERRTVVWEVVIPGPVQGIGSTAVDIDKCGLLYGKEETWRNHLDRLGRSVRRNIVEEN